MDALLSAAIDKENFNLTIRKIERCFNRLGRYAKELGIPEGISTLGYAGCQHWAISQYIFGLPIISPNLQQSSKFKLVMNEADINKSGFYITEIHPALSMWILLKKIDTDKIIIKSDDELDAFVCWLIASLLVKNHKSVKIYGDRLNGSFLLPYNEELYNELNS